MRQFLKSILPQLIILCVISTAAWAATDHLAQHYNWTDLKWRVINLIIFTGTLYLLMRKPSTRRVRPR